MTTQCLVEGPVEHPKQRVTTDEDRALDRYELGHPAGQCRSGSSDVIGQTTDDGGPEPPLDGRVWETRHFLASRRVPSPPCPTWPLGLR